MVDNSKSVFLKAFIVSLILFNIGILLGVAFENVRSGSFLESYRRNEISLIDIKLQNDFYKSFDVKFCDTFIKENLEFGDSIYEEGLKLEKVEESSQLTETILLDKKKYVLLKTEFWINSIIIKERCNSTYHTVVYFYTQYPNLVKKGEQSAISRSLEEIKKQYGNEVILLPIAGDLDLVSVNMLRNIYNVTSYPTILIDEKIKLEGLHSKQEIEKYL